ncbi:MAG TPA: sulfatase-like hydrolase/transferase [Chitinophagaceae bacterium]|nr:sulfatase-like hydrolase/transferase [Chitinophagaceae bacterium]
MPVEFLFTPPILPLAMVSVRNKKNDKGRYLTRIFGIATHLFKKVYLSGDTDPARPGGNINYTSTSKTMNKKVFHPLLFIPMLFWSGNDENNKPADTKAKIDYGQPNIIMIVVDDLRWDEFSAAGHSFLSTPNIDRLASEGVFFENAYHVVPLCSPNRASILTGQYPSRHGIIDNVARDMASHQLNLFPKELQKAGYETAHIDKWHMGNDPTPRPGYDYWCSFPGQGRTIDPQFYENDTLQTVKGYVTDLLTDRAIGFINKKRGKPFFLFVGHKAIHPDAIQLNSGALDLQAGSRYIPATRHEGKYRDAKFERRKNSVLNFELVDSQTVTGQTIYRKKSREIETQFGAMLDHFTSDKTIRERAEMLLAVDEGLGRILQKLEELKILDNTFILLTSDNGYFYGEHGLSLERRLPYEEAVRMPLLIRYPPLIKKNTRINEFVLSVDYAPTALELGGAGSRSYIQGQSIIPLLQGKKENRRKSFLMEYYSYENPMPWLIDTDYKALRTERYKYIHWYKYENRNELYDLIKDPFEMNNLVNEKNMQKVKKEMEEKLALEVVKVFELGKN